MVKSKIVFPLFSRAATKHFEDLSTLQPVFVTQQITAVLLRAQYRSLQSFVCIVLAANLWVTCSNCKSPKNILPSTFSSIEAYKICFYGSLCEVLLRISSSLKLFNTLASLC